MKKEKMPVERRSMHPSWLWIFPPFILFLAHAFLFRKWIIDDAGITFAYAKNLAAGYGLVAQPGVPPVEGYSNFLWVLTWVPFFLTHTFTQPIVPKVLSCILVLATFGIIYKVLVKKFALSSMAAMLVLVFVSINSSFVIWTTSGLENPLFVLLIVSLLAICLDFAGCQRITIKNAAAAACLSSAIALTRPDGIVYMLMFPATLVLRSVLKSNTKKSSRLVLPAYCLFIALILGAFYVFRFCYFHDIFPNTYRAKGGPDILFVKAFLLLKFEAIIRLVGLTSGCFGLLEGASIFVLVAMTACQITLKRFNIYHTVLLLFTVTAAGVFIVMPHDWMGEYRFGTPFIPLVFCYSVVLAVSYFDTLSISGRARAGAMVAVVLLFLCIKVPDSLSRSLTFIQDPPLPLEKVRRVIRSYEQNASILGVKHASMLVPDVGGALLYSHLRVYDLGMLSDRTIARTMGKDMPEFYDYIFEVAKPTFIHTHDAWATRANLDGDPRFRQDYVPFFEVIDPKIQVAGAKPIYSGDYVRKDVIRNSPTDLEKLRKL
jgi:hypothetical protein